MSSPDSPDSPAEAAVVVAFLTRYASDRAAGAALDLSTYQAMYPRFEAAIAREFAELSCAVPAESESESESEPTVIERLGRDTDPAITLDEPPAEFGPGRTAGMRYREIGEIARGGMGSIHEIWDRDLRRRLAMKVLLAGDEAREARASDPRSLSRFLEEAQITSQLDHPGIVPVHELGLDAEGRVYFTMSLIRGRDFKAIIDDVHAGSGEWTLTGGLGVVQRVCEAVAFANAKGVVHRDLKPGNVMVGRFGEVYVMDWGLARVRGRADRKDIRLRTAAGRAALSSIRTARTELAEESADSPLITMDGDVVGTPAYMPPEQARGEVDRVDERADVYSIGAMLYHLVTGKMPYLDETSRITSRTVLACVLRGPPRPPHELVPGVPAELVAICERAMAREPADRYADASELGADLRAFLEMRVVRAYETGAVAELRKWVRRNNKLAAASMAAVLALVAGLVFSFLEKGRADAAAGRADAAARRAETNFELAAGAVDELVKIGGDELRDVPQVDGVRRDMLQRALDFHLRFVDVRGDDPAVRERAALAWARVDSIREKLGDFDGALEANRAAIAGLEALVSDLPDRPDLEAELAWAHNSTATVYYGRGEYDDALTSYALAQEQFDDLVRRYPDEPRYRVRQGHVMHNRGATLNWQRRWDEALELMERVRGVRAALVADFPDEPEHADHLANAELGIAFALSGMGRKADAVPHLETAVRLLGTCLDAAAENRVYRSHAGLAWNQLGLAHLALKKLDDAREEMERAIEFRRGLARDFPHVPEYHGDLAGSLNNLGEVLLASEAFAAARLAAEGAIEERVLALAAVPSHGRFRRSMARHYYVLFTALRRQGEHRELARRAEEYVGSDVGEKARLLDSAGTELLHCAVLAGSDQTLSADERARVAGGYARRGLELFHEAFDGGWRRWVLEADLFDPVRGSDDFERLAVKVRAAAASETAKDGGR